MSTCPICLDDIKDADAAPAACGHRFHVACVRRWAQENMTCPCCRARLSCSRAPAVDNLHVCTKNFPEHDDMLRTWRAFDHLPRAYGRAALMDLPPMETIEATCSLIGVDRVMIVPNDGKPGSRNLAAMLGHGVSAGAARAIRYSPVFKMPYTGEPDVLTGADGTMVPVPKGLLDGTYPTMILDGSTNIVVRSLGGGRLIEISDEGDWIFDATAAVGTNPLDVMVATAHVVARIQSALDASGSPKGEASRVKAVMDRWGLPAYDEFDRVAEAAVRPHVPAPTAPIAVFDEHLS